MRTIIVIILSSLIISCASIESYRNLDQPDNQVLTTSIGGVIFRLNRSSDLPNAFGGADIYGGKIDRGYAEVKLKGIDNNGALIIQVTDINKMSSKTTIDRHRPLLQNNINQSVTIGDSNPNQTSTFSFDLSKEKELVIAGVKIIFLSAKSYSITYKLISRSHRPR